MKWVGCLNHNLTHATSEKPRESPTTTTVTYISGWHCILTPTNHSMRCWNTLYIYEIDLVWVWTGWGASIITYSMMQARNQVNCLRPLLYLSKAISGWSCNFMTTSHCSRCWNTFYMYEVNLLWVWSGWDASIIATAWYKWETNTVSYCCFTYLPEQILTGVDTYGSCGHSRGTKTQRMQIT